jgi:signal transduction histidine kinase/ActR/RegA family two-component response regulator
VNDWICQGKRKDGSTFWVSMSVQVCRSRTGEIVGSEGVVRDITERKRVDDELRRAVALSEALNKISATIHSTLEPSEVIQNIVDVGSLSLGSESAAISLRYSTGWLVRYVNGMPGEMVGMRMNDDQERHAVLATRSRQPVVVTDAWKDEWLNQGHIRKHNIRAVLVVPLIGKERPLGVIFFNYHSSPHLFTDVEVNFARQLAGIASAALDNAQLFDQRKRAEENLRRANANLERKVQERTEELAKRAVQLRALAGKLTLSEQRERRRMAKIMHDHLQQILVAAKFRVAILGRTGDDLVRQAAREVEDLLDKSIKTSRSLTAELSPPILHHAGLGAGLEWLVRWMADRHGLIVDLKIGEGTPALAEDVKVMLFESTRELLFNAVKHARVHTANVDVRRVESDQLQVTVSDEGLGFEPAKIAAAGDPEGGFGLFGIREHIELLGGQMEINSAPGQGSRFMLRVPMMAIDAQAEPVTEPEKLAKGQVLEDVSHAGASTLIRIMLADDHVVMRQGLGQLLSQENDFLIVGEAGDGQEAVDKAGVLCPDLILMDVNMPNLSGVEATRIIHNEYPEIRILGLSMFEDTERAQAMREAGAVDYVTKSGPSETLIEAVRACVRISEKSLADKPAQRVN